MKRLLLHPLAAPASCLRVWLGAFRLDAAPDLSWRLAGSPVVPIARRALRPAWSGATTGLRALTGVYEFPGLSPDQAYRIQVSDAVSGLSDELTSRTLPAELPSLGQGWFNVLLTSCFHARTDKHGRAGRLVQQRIPPAFQPDVTLLMGDQVYLDLPTLQNFRDDTDWLADTFERNYANTWRSDGAYARLLGHAPSVSSPDDHEYWNNYPHPATVIQNTWTVDGRERWAQAAREMYEAFQQPFPPDPEPQELGQAFVLDVGPLSIFLADNRSRRHHDLQHSMHPGALAELDQWATRVVDEQRYGVIVTGQSLFQGPTGSVQGTLGDRHLADYGDYDAIVKAVDRIASAGRPVLCITGDVHWGRVLEASRAGSAPVYEVISSPTSLVEVVGVDRFKRAGNWVRGLFGGRRDFPLHGDAAAVPEVFALDPDKPSFRCRGRMEVRGNQCTVLSFCRTGGGALRLDIRTWRIHEDGRQEAPRTLLDLKLRPTT